MNRKTVRELARTAAKVHPENGSFLKRDDVLRGSSDLSLEEAWSNKDYMVKAFGLSNGWRRFIVGRHDRKPVDVDHFIRAANADRDLTGKDAVVLYSRAPQFASVDVFVFVVSPAEWKAPWMG